MTYVEVKENSQAIGIIILFVGSLILLAYGIPIYSKHHNAIIEAHEAVHKATQDIMDAIDQEATRDKLLNLNQILHKAVEKSDILDNVEADRQRQDDINRGLLS